MFLGEPVILKEVSLVSALTEFWVGRARDDLKDELAR